MSSRIQEANKGYYGLEKVLESRTIQKPKNKDVRVITKTDCTIWRWNVDTEKNGRTEANDIWKGSPTKNLRPSLRQPNQRMEKTAYLRIIMNSQRLFQKPNMYIVGEIAQGKLILAGHAWRKRGATVKRVIEEYP